MVSGGHLTAFIGIDMYNMLVGLVLIYSLQYCNTVLIYDNIPFNKLREIINYLETINTLYRFLSVYYHKLPNLLENVFITIKARYVQIRALTCFVNVRCVWKYYMGYLRFKWRWRY